MKKKYAIIGHIKNNLQKKIKQYKEERFSGFKTWASKRFKATEAEVRAGYDKAFEIFCQKIKDDKFRPETAKPETFLFKIGIYRMLKIKYPKKRKKKRIVSVAIETIADSSNNIDEKIEQDYKNKLFEYYYKKLPRHCPDLIRCKKMDKQSIAQITKEKNYKNDATTKVAISKCFGCLKKMVIEDKKKGIGFFRE